MAESLDNQPDPFDDFELQCCDSNSILSRLSIGTRTSSVKLKEQLDRWKKYLEDTSEDQDIQSDIFNLPEQTAIDEDCQNFVDELNLSENDQQNRYSALRTIITIYSISENKPYNSNNGWIPLLNRLIKKTVSKFKSLVSFKRMKDIYVPTEGTHGFLLYILLRYHDPEFLNVINIKRLTLAECTKLWFDTIFTSVCSEPVCDLLWNHLTMTTDPFDIFFIIMSIIKSRLGTMESLGSQKQIKKSIELLPTYINTNDVEYILHLAMSYEKNTPMFFKTAFYFFMFENQPKLIPKSLPKYLPLSASSVLNQLRFGNTPNDFFNYLIVDCRSLEEYNTGRLLYERMHHVNCCIFTSSSLADIDHVIDSLHKYIQNVNNNLKNKEIHVCLMGSRLGENDECVLTVAMELLKRNQKYVSILQGGFEIIHRSLQSQGELSRFLINHNERKCIVCTKSSLTKRMKKRLMKSTHNLRKELTSCVSPDGDWKDEFINSESDDDDDDTEIVINEPINQSSSADPQESAESSSEDPQENAGSSSANPQGDAGSNSSTNEVQLKLVSSTKYLNFPNVIIFKCKERDELSGRLLESKLLVTDKELIHLRNVNDLLDKAYLVVKCHILCIQECYLDGEFVKLIFDRKNKAMIISFNSRQYLIEKSTEFRMLIHKKITELTEQYMLEHEN